MTLTQGTFSMPSVYHELTSFSWHNEEPPQWTPLTGPPHKDYFHGAVSVHYLCTNTFSSFALTKSRLHGILKRASISKQRCTQETSTHFP